MLPTVVVDMHYKHMHKCTSQTCRAEITGRTRRSARRAALTSGTVAAWYVCKTTSRHTTQISTWVALAWKRKHETRNTISQMTHQCIASQSNKQRRCRFVSRSILYSKVNAQIQGFQIERIRIRSPAAQAPAHAWFLFPGNPPKLQ